MQNLKRDAHRIVELWNSLGTFKSGWSYYVFLTLLTASIESVGIGMVLPILNLLVSESETRFFDSFLPATLRELDNEQLAIVGLLVLTLFLLARSTIEIHKSVFLISLVQKIRNRWRLEILSNILYSRGVMHEYKRHGETLDTLLTQTSGATKFLRSVSELLTGCLYLFIMFVTALLISWEMTLLVAAVFLVLMLAVKDPMRQASSKIGRQSRKIAQRLAALFSEAIRGAREIRILSIEEEQIELVAKANTDELKVARRLTFLSALPVAITQIMVACLLLVGAICVNNFSDIRLQDMLPAVATFVIVAQRFGTRTSVLMSKLVEIRSKYPSFSLVMGFLNNLRYIEKKPGNHSFANFTQSLQFSHVTFWHQNSKKVLRDFHLTIPAGKFVALVGPSGSGKTTIADLLLRLREPQEGVISADNVDIADFDVTSWRSQIGYVSQSSFLFNISIEDNIRLGRRHATSKEVEIAAKAAHAHEFILGLPNGYQTNVGEAGDRLSGGQRQRVVLAQVLLRDPALYILDEPTSALDFDSRNRVLETFRNLVVKGRTILLITHDLELAADADICINL